MSISFQKNNRLAEEAKHQSTGDNGCDLSGNVRSYRIHQYEVLRVFFRCHLLDDPAGHREGRNTGTTNHWIDFLGAEQVQEFSKQHPADCIHDEGNQTEGDNHQRLQIQEQFSLHFDGNRDPQQDADDVAALLKDLNIAKADFLGFSNGGTTTLQIAIRHPQLVNKMILASALAKRNGVPDWFWNFIYCNSGKMKNIFRILYFHY